MKTIVALLMSLFFLLSSCYRDVEDDLYPAGGGACDTTGITYSATIQPLLQSSGCLGCHSGGAPSGGISLEGYTNVKTLAQNGKLYGTISHAAGYSPMPKGGNKLSACNITKVKAWIDSGIPNN